MTTKRLYIAYGSNLHRGQMAHRCPDATVEGVSSIPDYTLLFRGSGVATIEPKKGDSVPIVVWNISKHDEQRLDIYEGFPHLYIKQDFKIKLNGESVTAMAYIMTPGRVIAEPPVHYYNTILTGYKDFGFDTAYLKSTAKACTPKRQQHKAIRDCLERSLRSLCTMAVTLLCGLVWDLDNNFGNVTVQRLTDAIQVFEADMCAELVVPITDS